jgi:predicted enzyme related to lactoylglutathione lyase
MTNIHHAISYVELGVSDLAATKKFYSDAFGWRFQDYGPDYAGIQGTADGDEVGGLNAMSEPGQGGALVLLYSEDLDATLAAVERAGGGVTVPPFDYPGGRRFHFSDPSGNVLGVFQPAHG